MQWRLPSNGEESLPKGKAGKIKEKAGESSGKLSCLHQLNLGEKDADTPSHTHTHTHTHTQRNTHGHIGIKTLFKHTCSTGSYSRTSQWVNFKWFDTNSQSHTCQCGAPPSPSLSLTLSLSSSYFPKPLVMGLS